MSQSSQEQPPQAIVIGAGPAGLMAAETLAGGGIAVTVFDQMPSPGRKFLMAGRGGLNLTHSEPLPAFLARYGKARPWLDPVIAAFPPQALIAWAESLGQPTFTGTSGRVFPKAMKASPLLRAWLARLAGQNVTIRTRHRWTGWSPYGALLFDTPDGPATHRAKVTILALGGASWPRLGSDAAWTALLPDQTAPFRPANCGFSIAWTPHFQERFAGQPLKRIALTHAGRTIRGEAMLTREGIEGGAVYALSAPIRDAIAATGPVTITIDLRPDLDEATLALKLNGKRDSQSLSTFLRKHAALSPAAIGLVQEALHNGSSTNDLAALVKALPLLFLAARPIGRTISSAGGIRLSAMDGHFMLRDHPGVFAAGEMLDWEAPTGGYLLQACFSTGRAAAQSALTWLAERN